MTLESATYIDDLNQTYPEGSAKRSKGDDHIRLLKDVLKNTFPNVNGEVKPTPAEFNQLQGISSGVLEQDDLAANGGSIAENDRTNGWSANQVFNSGITLDRANFDNSEKGDFDTDGDVYFDSSAGLYVKATSVPGDQNGGNLVWTSGNFTPGDGLTVSYNTEDEPTLSQNLLPSGTKMVFYQSSAPTGWTQDTSVNDQVLRTVSGSGGGSGGTGGIAGLSTKGHTLTEAQMPSHNHGGGGNTGSAGSHSHARDYDHARLTGDSFATRYQLMESAGNGDGTFNTRSVGNHNHSFNIPSDGGDNAHSHNIDPQYIDVIVATKD